MVTDLAHVDHRLELPAGNGVRGDDPLDRAPGRTGGDQRPHDEPAIVTLGAGIEQHEVAGPGLDQHALPVCLGSNGELGTGGQRKWLHLVGAIACLRAVRLPREDA